MPRRQTVTTHVGGVPVGSAHPVVVQSMTNTDTADVAGTVAQVRALAEAGSELVRVTVNNEAAAQAVPEIATRLTDAGVTVPLIGDFHYNGHQLLPAFPACARALAKYRINPGNVGAKRRDENFRTIVAVAVDHGKPVRIGVNWGSLDRQLLTDLMDANGRLPAPRDARDVMLDAMVESAMRSAELAEEVGLPHDGIILSAKISRVLDLVDVYRLLAPRSDYPLHLGLTEAGMGPKGIIASSAGLAILLAEGIGDTIRVSLTEDPTEEVRAGFEILKALGLRKRGLNVIACPSCGRVEIDLVGVTKEVERRLEALNINRSLTVAVMGCAVNGPGEARGADIGIAGGKGVGILIKRGQIVRKVKESELADVLVEEVKALAAKAEAE